uniref:SFRICE_009879 n=1 Tax=Spodoptera frugiperda TaxID=7108 RepID=A0A2H1WFZ7_SPOFR
MLLTYEKTRLERNRTICVEPKRAHIGGVEFVPPSPFGPAATSVDVERAPLSSEFCPPLVRHAADVTSLAPLQAGGFMANVNDFGRGAQPCFLETRLEDLEIKHLHNNLHDLPTYFILSTQQLPLRPIKPRVLLLLFEFNCMLGAVAWQLAAVKMRAMDGFLTIYISIATQHIPGGKKHPNGDIGGSIHQLTSKIPQCSRRFSNINNYVENCRINCPWRIEIFHAKNRSDCNLHTIAVPKARCVSVNHAETIEWIFILIYKQGMS